MSPPIRDGSGSSIGAIRLGDGSEISEVRTGAGDVLFSATPDNAVYRYQLDDVASGSVSDSAGAAPDGTVNGVTSISGNYQGGGAGETTTTDGEHINLNSNLPDFESNITSGFSIGFTIDNTSTQPQLTTVFGIADSSFNNVFRLVLNSFEAPSTDSLAFKLQEAGNSANMYSDGVGVYDGSKHRVLMGLVIDTNSDGDVFVDSSSNGRTFSPDNISTWTSPSIDYYLYNNNFAGSPSDGLSDGVIDDFIIYDKLPDSTLAQADYDLQPWS